MGRYFVDRVLRNVQAVRTIERFGDPALRWTRDRATQAYLEASYHLGVPPERVAMVAAHKWDLDGAAQAGFKTIYVPRPAEDTREIRENMRSKTEGGDVDLVVKDFWELATLAAEARK